MGAHLGEQKRMVNINCQNRRHYRARTSELRMSCQAMRHFPSNIICCDFSQKGRQPEKMPNKTLIIAYPEPKWSSFGAITSKFRVLNNSIETSVGNAVHIVKAICILHNTIKDLEGMCANENNGLKEAYRNMPQTSKSRYNSTARNAATSEGNIHDIFSAKSSINYALFHVV